MKKRNLLTVYLSVVIFLYPLFFFPLFREAFVLGKNFFLVLAVLVGLILWVVTLWREKEVRLYFSSGDMVLLLLTIFSLVYTFFLPQGNRYEALFGQASVGSLVMLFALAFLLGQTELREKPKRLFSILGISGAIAALATIALFVVPNSAYPIKIFGENSPIVIGGPLWSPTGSILELVWLLLPVFVFQIINLIRQVNREGKPKEWHRFVLAIVLLVGLVIAGIQFFRLKFPVLDLGTSWSVVTESFKKRPFFGVGPARFGEVFTLFRPREFNSSQWWTVRFTRPMGFYFQIWSELGILGLLFFFWFLFKVKKEADRASPELRWVWFVLMAMGLVFPAALIFSFLLLIVSLVIREQKEVVLPYPKISLQVLSGLLAALVLATGYFYQKAVVGEFFFFRFVRGISIGKADDNDYYRAVRSNPYEADFRIFRSQVDLSAMNNIIASVVQTEGAQLDETQRNQVSLLAQEGINEAKAAVALRPGSVVGWENLASVYRQLITLAQGADQWTISSYLQAISLDPFNSQLRINLGGVYYALGNFEEAGRQFEVAVNLKRDFANSWYNWAWALRQQKKTRDAVAAMQQVLLLLDVGSADYEKAQSEMNEWRKELEEEEKKEVPAKTEELTTPETLPSPPVKEPIKLPEEAAPEIEITPSPEPTATP